jgi:hypothetical protein
MYYQTELHSNIWNSLSMNDQRTRLHFSGVCAGALISLIATPLIQTFDSHPGYDGITTYPEG